MGTGSSSQNSEKDELIMKLQKTISDKDELIMKLQLQVTSLTAQQPQQQQQQPQQVPPPQVPAQQLAPQQLTQPQVPVPYWLSNYYAPQANVSPGSISGIRETPESQ